MSTSWTLRPAIIQDAQAIAYVHIESWRSTYMQIFPSEVLAGLSLPERTQNWQTWNAKNPHGIWVAERDSEIVGFVSFGEERSQTHSEWGEVYALYLLAACQGQGLGKNLLLKAFDCLKKTKFRKVLIWVASENHTAYQFYLGMGGKAEQEKKTHLAGCEILETAFIWE